MTWNPNDPGTLGLEWNPTGTHASQPLTSDTRAVAQVMRAEDSNNIDNVLARLITQQGAYPSSKVLVEVFQRGSEVPSDVQTSLYLPNEDAETSNVMAFGAGAATATTNLYTYLDDPNPRLPTPHINGTDLVDIVTNINWSSTPFRYAARYATGTFPSGRRILAVRFIAAGYQVKIFTSAVWQQYLYERMFAIFDGVEITLSQGRWSWPATPRNVESRTVNPALTVTDITLPAHPIEHRPWLLNDVLRFDTVDSFGVQFGSGGGLYHSGGIAALAIEVVHCAENRLAWTVLDAHPPGENWVAAAGNTGLQFWTPSGGAVKTAMVRSSGIDYTYLLRRQPAALEPYVGSVAYIPGTPNRAGWAAYEPALDQLGYVVDMGPAAPRTYPIVPRRQTGGGNVAPEANPYGQVAESRISAGRVNRSRFRSVGGGGTVALLRFVCWPRRTAPPVTGPLVARIRRASDDAAIGGTASITHDEWAALPGVHGSYFGHQGKLVTLELSSGAAIANATSYYVDFTSTATGDPSADGHDGWGVMFLMPGNGGTPPDGTASYQGTVEFFTNNGTGGNSWDGAVQAIVQAPAPTSLTATIQVQALPDDGTGCPNDWEFARVVLDDGVTTSFLRHELQRSEDGGATWEPVAVFTDPAVTTFDDYEGRRGAATRYRARFVRADGAPSAWVESGLVTPQMLGGCNRVGIISNFDPSLNVAWHVPPDRTFDFLDAEEVDYFAPSGRDKWIAVRPLEERGVRWTFTATVHCPGNPLQSPVAPDGGHGLGALVKARALGNGAVPYLAVLDAYGTRLLASVRVLRGTTYEPFGDDPVEGYWSFTADIEATEIDTHETVVSLP